MKVNEVNLVFFSPTNTSRKIASAIATGTGVKNVNVYDATKSEVEFEADGGSLTIVAVPVYGGHIALTARKRIERIVSKGAPVVPVAVYGNRAYEDALNELSALFEGNGFVTVAAATFVGEHSYSTNEKPIAQGRPDDADLQFAQEFGKSIVAKLTGLACSVEGRVDTRKIKKPAQPLFPLLGFIYKVIRLRRSKTSMPQTPATDNDLCTHCGMCVKVCPVAAIEKGREETTNASRCIRCCACVKRCPHGARSFDTPFADLLARYFKSRKANCTII